MFEFWLSSLHTYCLFDVSNTSYYVEVENGALCTMSCGHGKWSLEVMEKSWKSYGKLLGKSVGH